MAEHLVSLMPATVPQRAAWPAPASRPEAQPEQQQPAAALSVAGPAWHAMQAAERRSYASLKVRCKLLSAAMHSRGWELDQHGVCAGAEQHCRHRRSWRRTRCSPHELRPGLPGRCGAASRAVQVRPSIGVTSAGPSQAVAWPTTTQQPQAARAAASQKLIFPCVQVAGHGAAVHAGL